MQKIKDNASQEVIVKTINNLISAYRALAEALDRLRISEKFADFKHEFKLLEKKIISQGDLIVSLINRQDQNKK